VTSIDKWTLIHFPAKSHRMGSYFETCRMRRLCIGLGLPTTTKQNVREFDATQSFQGEHDLISNF